MKKVLLTISLGSMLIPQVVLGAIAYDAHSEVGDTTSTGQTWSHTVTGSDTILFVYGWARGPTVVPTSVTYNGVSMTQVTARKSYVNDDISYLYVLVAPATGAHNIVVTLSGSEMNGWQATSYTGASPYNQPSVYSSDAGTNGLNNYSMNASTTVDNSWLIGGHRSLDGTCTAGSGTVIRGTNDAMIADSGGAKTPAGNYSLNYTGCGNRVAAQIWAAFQPATTTGGSGGAGLYSTSSPFVLTYASSSFERLTGVEFNLVLQGLSDGAKALFGGVAYLAQQLWNWVLAGVAIAVICGLIVYGFRFTRLK